MGPADDVAEPVKGPDVAADCRPSSDEAIRAAFCLKAGSEIRSCSEVSVITTIEDDGRLLAASVASLLHLYATKAADGGVRQVSAFDSPFVPKFSVHDFLSAIVQAFQLSSECCAVAFIYIDRFTRMHPKFAITFTNVHRFLLTSLVVAAKYYEDVRHSNLSFAVHFGLSAKQMSGMELYFVRGLNWALYVSQQECEECVQMMLEWGGQPVQPRAEPAKQAVAPRVRSTTRPRRVVQRF